MKFIIKHEIRGRLRIHVVQPRMTYAEADTLSWYLERRENKQVSKYMNAPQMLSSVIKAAGVR